MLASGVFSAPSSLDSPDRRFSPPTTYILFRANWDCLPWWLRNNYFVIISLKSGFLHLCLGWLTKTPAFPHMDPKMAPQAGTPTLAHSTRGHRWRRQLLCQSSINIILENAWWKTNPPEAYNVHFTSTGHRMRSSSAVSAACSPAPHWCYCRRALLGQKTAFWETHATEAQSELIALWARSDAVGLGRHLGNWCRFLMHAVNQALIIVSKKCIPIGRNEHPGQGAALNHAWKLGDLENQGNKKHMKFNSAECQVLLSGAEQALLT